MTETTDDFVESVDLAPWYDGDDEARAAVAEAVDASLGRAGFVVVTGHGVEISRLASTRRRFADLFELDDGAKEPWRSPALGVPGWIPFGMEANGYLFGEATPPDLKESFVLTAGSPDGLVAANPWLASAPIIAESAPAVLDDLERLHLDLLEIMGTALGLVEPTFFADRARGAINTLNINWYPPITRVGAPAGNQYRIGPHTDFGSITILDRQPGVGGLQVQTAVGDWVDAPWVPGSLTVNVGDLLQLWSGHRWKSAVHRVKAPSGDAPDEELISLIYFCEPRADVIVEPLDGSHAFEPQRAGDYLAAKLAEITV
jgi:isopenicillin N synthase-like dioxygenase